MLPRHKLASVYCCFIFILSPCASFNVPDTWRRSSAATALTHTNITDEMHHSHQQQTPEILVEAGPRFGPEFLSRSSKRRAGLAVFVCVSAPALLPVALRCQPAHCPPVRPVEHSPAATAQHRHPSDWGFLLDWLKCLLFSTLLEFNTSLFTGPHVAPVSLPSSSFLSAFFPPFHNIPSLYGVCILLSHKVRTQHT